MFSFNPTSYIHTLRAANRLSLFSSILFLIINFFRAFYEDRLHRRELVYICDVLLCVLNILFLFCAGLYWLAYAQQRINGTIKDSNNIYNNNGLNEHFADFSNNNTNNNINNTSYNSSRYKSYFWWYFSTFRNKFYLSPIEGFAEFLNVFGCLLYLFSSFFPLFTYLSLSEVAEAHLDQITYILDCFAMLVFLVDSYYYMKVWLKNYEQDLTNRINRTQMNLNNFYQHCSGDAYFYGNLINIIACFCYFISVTYGLYIRLLTPTDGRDLTPIKDRESYSDFTLWQRMIFNSTQQQRALMFIGDILYFICAICSEIGYRKEFSNNNNSRIEKLGIEENIEKDLYREQTGNSVDSEQILLNVLNSRDDPATVARLLDYQENNNHNNNNNLNNNNNNNNNSSTLSIASITSPSDNSSSPLNLFSPDNFSLLSSLSSPGS